MFGKYDLLEQWFLLRIPSGLWYITLVQSPALVLTSVFWKDHISLNSWTQMLIFEHCSSFSHIFQPGQVEEQTRTPETNCVCWGKIHSRYVSILLLKWDVDLLMFIVSGFSQYIFIPLVFLLGSLYIPQYALWLNPRGFANNKNTWNPFNWYLHGP